MESTSKWYNGWILTDPAWYLCSSTIMENQYRAHDMWIWHPYIGTNLVSKNFTKNLIIFFSNRKTFVGNPPKKYHSSLKRYRLKKKTALVYLLLGDSEAQVGDKCRITRGPDHPQHPRRVYWEKNSAQERKPGDGSKIMQPFHGSKKPIQVAQNT